MRDISNEIIENSTIRHHFDESLGVWYYSIVDVIENLSVSSDSRNYWKVLKSRLKNTQNKLVTKCNQVKMPARDGKSYLTDATDIGTILEIIQTITPERVSKLRAILNEIEKSSPTKDNNSQNKNSELSTPNHSRATEFTENNDDVAELSVDIYQNENYIIINSMIAGVDPDDIFLSATIQNITIKGTRTRSCLVQDDNSHLQELFWGKFSREIILLEEIDIDRIETTYSYGLLTLKLFKIDKTRTKIIKVK